MTRWSARWLSLAALVSLGVASPATAQVQGVGAGWTNVYSAASGNSANVTSTSTATVPTGSNRLLLLGVVMELSGANTLTSISATFGGAPMTLIASSGGVSRQEQAALFYLADAQIPSGPQTFAVNYNVNGATTTVSGLHMDWRSYIGVDQASPLVDSSANNSGAANVTFGSQVDYVADGLVAFAAGNGGAAVLLISEDLDELIELSDRVLVMSEGRIVFQTSAPAGDRASIGRSMGGHHLDSAPLKEAQHASA